MGAKLATRTSMALVASPAGGLAQGQTLDVMKVTDQHLLSLQASATRNIESKPEILAISNQHRHRMRY